MAGLYLALGIALVSWVGEKNATAALDFELVGNFGGVPAIGMVSTEDNGNGTYTATSGYLNILTGLDAGLYQLHPNPNAPNPGGNQWSWLWDNQIMYPGNYSSTSEHITEFGFLFVMDGGWVQLRGLSNLETTSPGYEYSAANNRILGTHYFTAGVQLTLTPVPEPSTIIAGALLLLPFGAQAFRHLRNRKRVV